MLTGIFSDTIPLLEARHLRHLQTLHLRFASLPVELAFGVAPASALGRALQAMRSLSDLHVSFKATTHAVLDAAISGVVWTCPPLRRFRWGTFVVISHNFLAFPSVVAAQLESVELFTACPASRVASLLCSCPRLRRILVRFELREEKSVRDAAVEKLVKAAGDPNMWPNLAYLSCGLLLPAAFLSALCTRRLPLQVVRLVLPDDCRPSVVRDLLHTGWPLVRVAIDSAANKTHDILGEARDFKGLVTLWLSIADDSCFVDRVWRDLTSLSLHGPGVRLSGTDLIFGACPRLKDFTCWGEVSVAKWWPSRPFCSQLTLTTTTPALFDADTLLALLAQLPLLSGLSLSGEISCFLLYHLITFARQGKLAQLQSVSFEASPARHVDAMTIDTVKDLVMALPQIRTAR